MDIRCGSCSKLFRVADDKIAGKGIRFKCSRCGETVTVTRDDFERDKASRETAVPSAPVQVPAAPAAPAPAAQQPAVEFQPQEYKPPAVPAGMDDFDFSEPHAAAAAGQEDASFGGGFSFGDMAGQEGQEGESAAPEISLSEEDAQEAESAAFQFPADIISEPKPLPSSKSKPAPAASSADLDIGDALAIPAAAPVVPKSAPAVTARKPAPAAMADEDLDLGAALAIPKAAPPEAPKPAAALKTATAPAVSAPAPKEEEELDLGSALSMPKAASDEPSEPEPSEEAGEGTAGAQEELSGEGVSPFASGNLTGAVAGFLCVLPVLYYLTLGFGKAAELVPVLAVLPNWYLLSVSVTGVLGLGIVIGMVIAILQAQTGKRFFFLVNMLIGALFGALVGAAMGAIISLASGGGLNVDRLLATATLWGGASLAISSVLALARAILVRKQDETFAADLTGLQKAGLGLSGLVILAGLYGAGTFSGQMEHAELALAKQRQEILKKQVSVILPEGLVVVNSTGYVDPATGDLVITGTVQNATDKPKQGWYLETEIYDAGQKVLSVIRVLNGVQMFTQHDRDVLAKRKANIDALREKMITASGGGAVPARGSVPFEVRLYEPQPGIASFLPLLKRFELEGKSGK